MEVGTVSYNATEVGQVDQQKHLNETVVSGKITTIVVVIVLLQYPCHRYDTITHKHILTDRHCVCVLTCIISF